MKFLGEINEEKEDQKDTDSLIESRKPSIKIRVIFLLF